MFGLDKDRIWPSVFGGDDELGLGPDEESIEIWKSHGIPDERIVLLPRSENFWQAGETGPCGPCSEMYYDRGKAFGATDERPGDDTDRYIEYWNHVFMSYELHEDGSLTKLPANNIDTGLGLERMAAILQNVDSVFQTDAFSPLVGLAEEMSGRSYEQDRATTRAMRIIADHSRGMTFLIADGVVPSNEDRGYVLRRVMRRAIQQGRVAGARVAVARPVRRADDRDDVRRLSRARGERDTIHALGRRRGGELRPHARAGDAAARAAGRAGEGGGDVLDRRREAFKLHDTYGFPYDLTQELLAEEGLSVDDAGFEELMEEQRERARTGAEPAVEDRHEAVMSFAPRRRRPTFVGYETLAAETSVAARSAPTARRAGQARGEPLLPRGRRPGRRLGVGRAGTAPGAGRRRLPGRRRPGDPRSRGPGRAPEPGERVAAEVDRATRHATMRNHTATHLLHAALRERLGTHVRQAGSAVRPDKLRFDFTHGARARPRGAARRSRIASTSGSRRAGRCARCTSSRAEAEELGAMALFGEKYGDWVRVVEVEGVSRELCGGTHVANTAEVGIFKIVSRGVERRQRAPHRGGHRAGGDRLFRERERRARARPATILGSPREPSRGRARGRAFEAVREAARRTSGAARRRRPPSSRRRGDGAGGVKVVTAQRDGVDRGRC